MLKNKTSMGAGKGWNSLENIMACKAFVSVSEDPIKGTSQKAKHFAESIESEFNICIANHKGTEPATEQSRSGSSIFQRYKKIKKDCLEFEKCYQRVCDCDLTGSPTFSDKLNVTLALYNDLCNGSLRNMYSFIGEDAISPGKPFIFANCYEFLSNTQLWKLIRTIIATTRADTKAPSFEIGMKAKKSETEDADLKLSSKKYPLSFSPQPSMKIRPEGSKKAIEKEKTNLALKGGADQIGLLVQQSAKRSKLFEDFVKVTKQQHLVSLFSVDGTSPAMREKFLRVTQEKALRELMSEDLPLSRIGAAERKITEIRRTLMCCMLQKK